MIIAFLMIAMPVSATEIRGSVAKTGDHTATWTADNFAAFSFDVNNDNFVGEKLEIKDIEGTSIPENHLVYTTTGIRYRTTMVSLIRLLDGWVRSICHR